MKKTLLFLIICLSLTGCVQNVEIANTNIKIDAGLNVNKNYQEQWVKLEDGLEYKEMPIYSQSNNETLLDVVTVFKFNPDNFKFSLKQNTIEPLTISEWQNKYKPLFVCNGGYFLEDNSAAGILKIDGKKYGTNLTAESVGELIIEKGEPKILVDADITQYNNVLQSYPLLVQPNGVKTINKDSGQTAPRTVIAMDNNDQLLLIFTQSYYFSLYKLQNYLAKSDLNIKIALNLDGGPSTGYYYNGETNKISESAAVPNVIIVEKNN